MRGNTRRSAPSWSAAAATSPWGTTGPLDAGVVLQVGHNLSGVGPAVPGGGAEGSGGPVEGAQPVRLLADEQVLRGAGHKGKGDKGRHQHQQSRFHRLAQGGFEKDVVFHGTYLPFYSFSLDP